MKKTFVITALVMAALASTQSAVAQQSGAAPGTKKGLAGLFSSASENELIDPDAAFQLKVVTKGANILVAELTPAKGYYLYKEKIRFSIQDSNGVSIAAARMPAGEIKTDQIFGRTEIYRKAIPVEITLNRASKASRVTLAASYQGCHEKLGVCYPPIDKTVVIMLQ